MQTVDEIIDSIATLAQFGLINAAFGRLQLAQMLVDANTLPDPLNHRNRLRERIAATEDFLHRRNAGL